VLAFRWWQDRDAGTVDSAVEIRNSNTVDQASFVVPNQPGRTMHIILEVTDHGAPPLVSYRRIVFTLR
jgi:hypothetical protein